MERELQQKREKKRAIIVLSFILAVMVALNIIMWAIALSVNNGVNLKGTIKLETHFFEGQKISSLNFPEEDFVSEGNFKRLLVLNNKDKDCYLRFWLISKMGENSNNLTEVDNIITMTARNSFSGSGYELSIVENERYLTASDGKIYYTTDNLDKESVFQKNTTASIELTFQVADLSDEDYLNKVYKFELFIEAVDVNNTAISNWIVPINWPKEI